MPPPHVPADILHTQCASWIHISMHLFGQEHINTNASSRATFHTYIHNIYIDQQAHSASRIIYKIMLRRQRVTGTSVQT